MSSHHNNQHHQQQQQPYAPLSSSPYYNSEKELSASSMPIGIPKYAQMEQRHHHHNHQQQQHYPTSPLQHSSSVPLHHHHPHLQQQQHHNSPVATASSLDADTVAYATAAAAAAYHDAIAARTGSRNVNATTDTPPRSRNLVNVPPTPTSPTKSLLLSSYGSDTISSPLNSPFLDHHVAHSAGVGYPLAVVGSPNSGRKMQMQRTPQRQHDTPPSSGGPAGSRHRSVSNELQLLPASSTNFSWSSEESLASVAPLAIEGSNSNCGGSSSHNSSSADIIIHSSDSQETPNSSHNSPISTASSNDGGKKSAAAATTPVVERADSKKMNLYKTELCRSWEETGTCRYGNKCQFAHSVREVRNIDRHPKYKTEMCKTFWDKGTCPYGKRCCFIHTERQKTTSSSSSSSGSSAKQSPSPQSATEERGPPMSPMQVTPPRARANSSATRILLDDSMDNMTSSSSPARRGKQPLGIFTDRSILGTAAGAATAPAMGNNQNGSSKSLFDAIPSHDFSLWSPSLVSPERGNGGAATATGSSSVFSFDQRSINESYMRQHYGPASASLAMAPSSAALTNGSSSSVHHHLEDNLTQVEQALHSFQINSPLDVGTVPSNPLALLSPITTRFNNDFRSSDTMHNNFSRSAMSAGIPTTSQAFFGGALLPESSSASAAAYEDDLSLIDHRFRRSRAATGTSLSSVPILATPPRGINSSSSNSSANNSGIISNNGGQQQQQQYVQKTRSESFGSNFSPLSSGEHHHFGTSLIDHHHQSSSSLLQQQSISHSSLSSSSPHYHRILSNNTVSPAAAAAPFSKMVYPASDEDLHHHQKSTATSNNNNNTVSSSNGGGGPVGRHGSLRKFDSGVSF